MAKKLCENRLRWFGNAERSEDQHESGGIQQRLSNGREVEWTPREETGRPH